MGAIFVPSVLNISEKGGLVMDRLVYKVIMSCPTGFELPGNIQLRRQMVIDALISFLMEFSISAEGLRKILLEA